MTLPSCTSANAISTVLTSRLSHNALIAVTTHWRVIHLIICGIKCHGTKELQRCPPRTLQCTAIRAIITDLAESENMHIYGVSFSGCVVTYHMHLTLSGQKIASFT